MEEDIKKKIMRLFHDLHKLRLEDIRDEAWSNYQTIQEKEKELALLLDGSPLAVAPYFKRERDQSDFLTYEYVRVFQYCRGTYWCIKINNQPNYFSCSRETVGLTTLCNNYYQVVEKEFMRTYNGVNAYIFSKVTQGHDTENQKSK
ncbi:MAG: hypothetical protein LUD72_04105 [Bacteroidales bacterium]|nr:hypothetical protein [Bacteroidales bacterium]